MIANTFDGIRLGHNTIALDRLGASVVQGHNPYLTCLTQIAQLDIALSCTDTALKTANYNPIFWAVEAVIMASPIALTYALSTNIQNKSVHNIVLFMHDNIGNLSKLVSTISLISIIYFGNILTSSVALAFYSIGYLDQKGILPEYMRKTLHIGQPFITAITEIFSGTPIRQLFWVTNLIMLITEKYFNSQSPETADIVHKDLRNAPLTHVTLPALLQNGFSETCLNRGHLHYPTLAPVPDVDVTDLYKICDNIHWENHLTSLQKKLANDPRWKERENHAGKEIEYLKRVLHSCIDSIINHSILQGEPTSYDMITSYLKIITAALPKQDEITQADVLMTLAVEGGEYCGSGKFRVISELYSSLVTESIDLPIETRVLQSLQQLRMRTFQGIYTKIWELSIVTSLLGRLIDFQDIHIFNQYVIYGASEFGLPQQGATYDFTIQKSPMVELFMKTLIGRPLRPSFWKGRNFGKTLIEGYTERAIVNHLCEEFGTELLPKMDFYAWWKDWINRQNISDESKNTLSDELCNDPPQLFNQPLEVNGKIQNTFITAMLLDIGVLTI